MIFSDGKKKFRKITLDKMGNMMYTYSDNREWLGINEERQGGNMVYKIDGVGLMELMLAPEWVEKHIEQIDIYTLRKIIENESEGK
jgi:hypothetical protein